MCLDEQYINSRYNSELRSWLFYLVLVSFVCTFCFFARNNWKENTLFFTSSCTLHMVDWKLSNVATINVLMIYLTYLHILLTAILPNIVKIEKNTSICGKTKEKQLHIFSSLFVFQQNLQFSSLGTLQSRQVGSDYRLYIADTFSLLTPVFHQFAYVCEIMLKWESAVPSEPSFLTDLIIWKIWMLGWRCV